MEPSRRRVALWAAATALAVPLAFAPAALGLRTLSQRDTDLLYAPVRTLVVEELRAGRLPLWNPYQGTGQPLFAEGIHSVLHPVSLLAAAVAPARIDVLILAYLIAAAVGAFALARVLGAAPPAAAGTGVGFALSGYALSMTGNLVFLAGLSTLPWVVAAARSAGVGARWGPVSTALAVACAFLSGDAQVAAVGVALGLALAADAGGRRGAARALGGIAAGVLLAGVQVVATWEILPLTQRGAELPADERTRWALAPARLLEWIVPGLFRGPLEEAPVSPSGASVGPPFAESVYLGAPVVVAAAVAVAARRRTALLLAGATGVLAWLAMGHHLGARPLLDGIPVWSRFRYSEKLMAPITLCFCALAAGGLDRFGEARLSSTWRRVLVGVAVAAGAASAALAVAPTETGALALEALGDAGPFYRSTLAAGLPHLAVALAAVLAADRLGTPSARTATLAALVALAPLAARDRGAHLGDPGARSRPAVRIEVDGPAPRVVHPTERLYDRGDPAGVVDATVRVESLLLGPAINVAHRVDTVELYGALGAVRLAELVRAFGGDWATAFRRFGVTHVVAQVLPADAPPGGAVGGRLVAREPSAAMELWAVPHRPWAFFASRAVAAASAAEARHLVVDLVARGDDATVVVEASAAPPTSPGRVFAVERRAGAVQVEAEADGPGLLVVQDAWWPGWRADLDGKPVELLPGDALVRAVRWPEGHHRLTMVYDPPGVRAGLIVSAAGAALVLLLAARATRRRRGPVP